MHQGGSNWSWGLALGLGVLSASASAAASSVRPVLVAPVVGSESITEADRSRIRDAVRRALEAHGHRVSKADAVLGRSVIACQTPECIKQALDAAGVEFAIVPALWKRGANDKELTLTLVQRQGRNLNADENLNADLDAVTRALVGELLARREAVLAAVVEPASAEPEHPNAWLAGPVLLMAAGTAAFIAIGVGAATRSDTQQLNTAAVAAWSTVGAAAIAGGVAWWVVGANRRRATTVSVRPTGFDLRLRF